MGLIMTEDGHVRPLRVSDLREVAERDERIRQLEELNKTLAAEVDAMRPVVEAATAIKKRWDDKRLTMQQRLDRLITLNNAVDTYESRKTK